MILTQIDRSVSICDAPRRNLSQSRQAARLYARTALYLSRLVISLLALAAWNGPLQAGPLFLPNASFESPVVPPVSPYAGPDMDSWQKSAQPVWYDPAQNYNTPWEYLMGIFYNVPNSSTFIGNCDGAQAAFLFAVPEVAIFQDYNSIYGTNTIPSHAFNALRAL